MYMDDLKRHKFLPMRRRRRADGHRCFCVPVAGIPTHRQVLLYT
jgi:hypothetical protein